MLPEMNLIDLMWFEYAPLAASAKRLVNAADICHVRSLCLSAGVSVAADVVDELIGIRPASQNVATSLRLSSGLS